MGEPTATDPRAHPVVVTPMVADDVAEATAVLARAFWPDPLFGVFARSRLQEHHALATTFAAFLADARPFGECLVARGGQRIIGAAAWMPPGAMPRTTGREIALQGRIAPVLATGRNRRLALRLLDAVDRHHPSDPHWYLFLLGTDPIAQGRGVGGLLMEPVLRRADEEGVFCYLETQKEQNLAYYRRYGFETASELRLDGGPPLWSMRREPREPD